MTDASERVSDGIPGNVSHLKEIRDVVKKKKKHTNNIKYIKKDVSYIIRKERKKHHKAKTDGRPEKAGCVIRLNTRERKVSHDGDIIGLWDLQLFFSEEHRE